MKPIIFFTLLALSISAFSERKAFIGTVLLTTNEYSAKVEQIYEACAPYMEYEASEARDEWLDRNSMYLTAAEQMLEEQEPDEEMRTRRIEQGVKRATNFAKDFVYWNIAVKQNKTESCEFHISTINKGSFDIDRRPSILNALNAFIMS